MPDFDRRILLSAITVGVVAAISRAPGHDQHSGDDWISRRVTTNVWSAGPDNRSASATIMPAPVAPRRR
jgi:hypothetical protein